MTLKKPSFIKKIDNIDEKEVKNKETNDRIRWIEHKEKQILYIDYSNFLNTDETIKTILQVNDFIKKLGKYELLLFVDVRKSNADEKIIVEALKNNALIIKPYIKKAAVIGVTTMQQIILTVVNVFSGLGIKPFNTIDEAKDWLIK
jgi:hypothetical protein